MRLPVFAALIASVALAAPADAASKKHEKTTHHRPSAGHSQPAPHPHDVYVGNELVGRDPDPFIRSQMMRNPHPWDGPD